MEAGYYGLVVTVEEDALAGPLGAPGNDRENNGIQLFPLDAPGELLGSPPAIKPLAIAECTEAYSACTVGKELEVGSWGPVRVEKEAGAIPGCRKGFPPPNVLGHFLWDSELVGGLAGQGSSINDPTKKGPPSWDDLGREAEGAEEGLEFLLGVDTANFPFCEGSVQVLELVRREASLKAVRVQNNSQKFEDSGWTFSLLLSQRYLEFLADALEDLQ